MELINSIVETEDLESHLLFKIQTAYLAHAGTEVTFLGQATTAWLGRPK
jgi:hypothetical protein